MDTLYLNRVTWDLSVDAYGNIALAGDPYAILQDVASACRLFIGELWYDTTLGIRYFEQVLGQQQPIQMLKTQLVAAALGVPGVTAATVYLSAIRGRAITGQVQVTLDDGSVQVVGL